MSSHAIDMTFLKLHPRTELWFKQREECRRCANCSMSPINFYDSGNRWGGGMRCKASEISRPLGRVASSYCIDAREPDQPCGPEARLFKEKV